MTQEEFDAIVANNTERRAVDVKPVSNGYEVRGMRVFLDPVSNAVVFQTQYEAIASDIPIVIASVGSFLDTGTFS